jgi:putative YphP/YqiW family bacilliredoxin
LLFPKFYTNKRNSTQGNKYFYHSIKKPLISFDCCKTELFIHNKKFNFFENMYPEELVKPMREDLVSVGFKELKTAQEVEQFMQEQKDKTLLVVINSVCGCAAGTARPGVKLALQSANKKPEVLATVFAGMEKDAVAKVREYTMPYPPSSPSIALFKNGELVHFVERHHIEGRSAQMIAGHLQQVFEEYC